MRQAPPPSGPLLWLLRAPDALYRAGWGRVLGYRFLALTHRGRRTGKLHRTVVEVVRYDPAERESQVMAAWGQRADWLRNLEAGGGLRVETAGQGYVPQWRILDIDEATSALADYERRNRLLMPVVRAVLSRFAGWSYDQTPESRRRLVTQLPIVGLRPR